MSVLRGSDTLKQAYPKINSKFDALDAKDRELQSNIDTSNRNNAAEIERIDNRIDNIVSQAGDDNTEIVDARLGADGKARPTLGTLVREIHEEVVEPKYTDPIVIEGGIGSIPDNVVEGQVSSRLLGQSVTNLLGGKGDNSWTLPARPNSGTAPIFFDNLNLPQDKYLIFYELMQTVETFTLNTPYYNIVHTSTIDPDHKTKNNTVGRKVWKLDAPEIITAIGWRVYDTESEVKVKNFMVVKATEEDWHLTEGELIQKYNWHNNTKSTISAGRFRVIGKNLFNGKIYKSGIDSNNGSFITTTSACRSGFIRVEPDTDYRISGLSNVANSFVAFYDSNKNYINRTVSSTVTGRTFTTPSNCMYIAFNQFIGTMTQDEMAIKLSNEVQIEKGATGTSYEPYQESELYYVAKDPATGEILWLRSVPSGAKDEVNVTSGVKTQRVGNVILDGDEDYDAIVTGVTVYRKRIVNWAGLNNYTSYLEMKARNDEGDFKVVHHTAPATSADFSDNTISTHNNDLSVYLLKSKVDAMPGGTIEEKFIAYLNQHPIMLTYQLAQEKIIELQPQSLTIYPNGTVYWEPIVKETAVYNNGISIDNGIPIKAIEKLYMTDGQTKTEIPIQNINIAPDGLSFTIVGATDGETYEYIYEYDSSLTTIPTMEIIANKNLKAIVRSTDKALTTLNSAVLDLNDFTVAMLLNHEMRLTLLEV